jgi:DNA-binding CsgD family transcriptional regulator
MPTGSPTTVPPLLERESERTGIDAALDATAAGDGALIVAEGPAGIGKSRLLELARERAGERGFRLLRARCGEFERDLAYGVVRQLFERALVEADDGERAKLLSGSAGLAAPALGLAAPEAAAQSDTTFAVMHGLYWLVSNLAGEQPLLLEVDDAHWADPPSLRFLLYLGARLDGVPAALATALRTTEPGVDEPPVLQLRTLAEARYLRPAPLSVEAVGAIVADWLGATPAREFVDACHQASAGNPFLLQELVAAVRADGVEPTAAGADEVRRLGPNAVAQALLLRLGRLPEACPALASAVAVLGTEVELRHAAALSDLDPGEATVAADALAAADVLAPELPLRFVHPVVREAIYSDLAPARRQALHAEAATMLRSEEVEADTIARHLLAVEAASDPGAVELLRNAAAQALARGAPDTAVRYLTRALAEPIPAEVEPDLLQELGWAEWLAGEDVPAAIEHLGRSVRLTTLPLLRAERVLIYGRARFSTGDITGAFEAMESELQNLEGVEGEPVMRLEAEYATVGLVHPPTAPRAVKRLEEVGDLSGASPAELLQVCNLAAWKWLDGTAEETVALARQALAGGRLVAAEGCDSIPIYEAAWALSYSDRQDLAGEVLDQTLAEARRVGSVFGFVTSCAVRAIVSNTLGDVPAAEAEARNGIDLGLVPPFDHPPIFAQLALALVERGELDEAERALVESGCGPYLPELVHFNPAFFARGTLRMAQARFEDALTDFLELGRRDEALGVRNPSIPWRCGAALAHNALGDAEQAAACAEEHLERAREWGTASALGTALRTQGVIAGHEGVEVLRDAVGVLADSPSRLEHARALVDLGSTLRRAGQRREAREPLRDGLDRARRCGGTALAERAHAELVTAGARPRRLQFSGVESLTASERRVAEMAASGQSNREIAQALFITVRTVENHLSRSYRKLDIRSREQLSEALAT